MYNIFGLQLAVYFNIILSIYNIILYTIQAYQGTQGSITM